MMTTFNLEAGVKGQTQHLEKIPTPWTSYKLFLHSEPLEAILGEIEGLFNRITPFDIKHVIWQPFCFLN